SLSLSLSLFLFFSVSTPPSPHYLPSLTWLRWQRLRNNRWKMKLTHPRFLLIFRIFFFLLKPRVEISLSLSLSLHTSLSLSLSLSLSDRAHTRLPSQHLPLSFFFCVFFFFF